MSSHFPAQPASTDASSSHPAEVSLLGRVALVAGVLAAWIVQHGYKGLFHDSRIYTLPAVARLHPDLLGNDIMLRFGSQDSYTLFSPLYAAAINLFGVDRAAALITLVSQLAFFVAAAFFVRRLMPERVAWLAIALAAVIPGFYGSRTIFTVVEDFSTPRLMAEALVLAGLTCFMARRYWIAALVALVAASLHPLMAAGGIAVAVFMMPAPPRTKAAILIGAALAATIVLGLLAARGAQLRFDKEWLHLLEIGTDYLFVSSWSIGSLARATVMLGTLLVGLIVLEKSPARSLCYAALFAAIAGTAVSFVGGDLMHIVTVVQVQLWRWNWIANLLAILFLPLILTRAWSKGPLWRTTALLLGAAWLCIPETYALEIMVLVVVLGAVANRNDIVVPARVGRQVFLGGCALAALALLYHVATSFMLANALPDQSDVPAWMQRLRGIFRSGLLLSAALTGLAMLAFRARQISSQAAVAACSIIVAAITLPIAWSEWTSNTFDDETFQAFAGWRDRIPVRTEVLWFDSPLASWLLLQRPSYLSNVQESAGLFSREAAMQMKGRMDRLAPFLASEPTVGWREKAPTQPAGQSTPVSLTQLCAATDVTFVVTSKNVSATPIATTPPGVSNRYNGAQLYRCPAAEG